MVRTAVRLSLFSVLSVGAGALSGAEADVPEAVEYTVRDGLPNFFAKLKTPGAAVRIGYLGGSITAQPGWRPKTLAMFREQFPGATVDEINAAIGGTGSDLGVFRLQHDVLRHDPDLLFVEFAVNDGGADPVRILRAMEGIVRQTYRHNPNTEICFVYTLTQGMLGELQAGKYPRAAATMEQLADHYGIPSIHMGMSVARLEKEGKVVFAAPQPKTPEEEEALKGKVLFSGDGVHPYPESGHELYLQAVARAMEDIREAGDSGPNPLREPLRDDNWEAAKLVPFSALERSAGWRQVIPGEGEGRPADLAKRFGGRLPEFWVADSPGEWASIRVRGREVRLYDLLGPDCGQVRVSLDGKDVGLRPRFDAYCTYWRLASFTAAGDLDPEETHVLRMEVVPDPLDKLAILHKRTENNGITELDPATYDGKRWYAGAVMLIGEVAPAE